MLDNIVTVRYTCHLKEAMKYQIQYLETGETETFDNVYAFVDFVKKQGVPNDSNEFWRRDNLKFSKIATFDEIEQLTK